MKHAKPMKAATAAQVQEQLDALEAERAEAIAEHLRLADEREAVLLDGSDDALRRHDEAMAKTKARAERAVLRYDRLLPDLDVARASDEQARRWTVYEAAKRKAADGCAALEEYEAAAVALGRVAKRIAAGNFAASEANRELPDGAAPLETPEPFNGAPARDPEFVDATVRVAIDRRTGKEVMTYAADSPHIEFAERKTGYRTMISAFAPARPHRSFMEGLRIPSRDEPGKYLF